MKVLALIPARIGSTEVKKKNLRSLCGKPLVYYSIIEALKSKELDRVVYYGSEKGIYMLYGKFRERAFVQTSRMIQI